MPLEKAKISVLDRGFIFGDGVYEVVPVYRRQAFRLTPHLRRLQHSLDSIKLNNPYSEREWTVLIKDLITLQPFTNQAVYLQITRGVAKRNHAFPKNTKPTVFMMCNPLATPSVEQIKKGVAAITAEDFRWHRCDIKSTSLLGNVLLRQLSAERGAMETILFRDGYLSEASASNVFIVKKDAIATPPKGTLILPGVTLDAVVDLLKDDELPLEVREIKEKEVREADEIWLSSSTKEVLAVTTLDGKPVGTGKPGPLFKRAHALYQTAKVRTIRQTS